MPSTTREAPAASAAADRLDRPQTARDLDPRSRSRPPRRHGEDRRCLGRSSRPRPVEVDHVEPARAGRGEPLRHRDRIVAVRGLALEVALAQADDSAAAQVDRRQDLEASCVCSSLPCYRISTLLRYNERGRHREMADDWRTPDVEELFDAILRLDDVAGDGAVLPRPVHAHRAARHGPALGGGPPARRRAALRRDLARTGASTATITRIASWLNHGEGGYRAMLDKLQAASRSGSRPYPVAGDR